MQEADRICHLGHGHRDAVRPGRPQGGTTTLILLPRPSGSHSRAAQPLYQLGHTFKHLRELPRPRLGRPPHDCLPQNRRSSTLHSVHRLPPPLALLPETPPPSALGLSLSAPQTARPFPSRVVPHQLGRPAATSIFTARPVRPRAAWLTVRATTATPLNPFSNRGTSESAALRWAGNGGSICTISWIDCCPGGSVSQSPTSRTGWRIPRRWW
ncbi:hypothetical protein N657DRAFT_361262 [Parathielavia appendiculata]|uniref:Uncharacterized protein n=1 Tax=Parathielavia appendiculata TaxID=2587402 RepID=A0AAN6Z4Z4_9PEZI|nr:hypothetical protein N657DRAFT_361262 [Parathielavia appendiculata]